MKLTIPPPMEPMSACPNVGCGVQDTSVGLVDHLVLCPRRVVECTFPGCFDRMPRDEVQKHIESTMWSHVENARFLEKIRDYELADMQRRNQALLNKILELERPPFMMNSSNKPLRTRANFNVKMSNKEHRTRSSFRALESLIKYNSNTYIDQLIRDDKDRHNTTVNVLEPGHSVDQEAGTASDVVEPDSTPVWNKKSCLRTTLRNSPGIIDSEADRRVSSAPPELCVLRP
jgi:hypothetical protein